MHMCVHCSVLQTFETPAKTWVNRRQGSGKRRQCDHMALTAMSSGSRIEGICAAYKLDEMASGELQIYVLRSWDALVAKARGSPSGSSGNGTPQAAAVGSAPASASGGKAHTTISNRSMPQSTAAGNIIQPTADIEVDNAVQLSPTLHRNDSHKQCQAPRCV